jgi:tRNA (mo5U34)-methyltransferase
MNSQSTTKDLTELKREIIRLGPWHLDVQVTPELSSSAFLDAPEELRRSWDAHPVTFIDQRRSFQRLMKTIYPAGLEGRSFLDCACNCGGYSFWMKEIGAGSCFGFDVRDHWIDQARFLLEHREEWPSDGMRFELLDLYDLPKEELEPFDVTLFKGIFYHLPDPVAGLKLAADLTSEVLIVDTAVRVDLDDGMLVLENEATAHPMSGVYGLNWLPTGPKVMERILNWMGFAETRLTSWVALPERPGRGRLRIIGARDAGRLERLGSVTELDQRPGPAR